MQLRRENERGDDSFRPMSKQDRRTFSNRAQIERADPEAKPYRLWDEKVRKLHLRVQPSGSKTWNVQWSRTATVTLGDFPVVTIDAARQRALVILAEVAAGDGATPDIVKKRKKATTLLAFLDNDYAPWLRENRKYNDAAIERIKKAFPTFLAKSLSSLDGFAIERWRMERLKSGTKKTTCNRDLDALRSAVNKAVEWKMLASTPLATVKNAKVDAKGRLRFLSEEEESRLLAALAARDEDRKAKRESFNQWRTDRSQELLPEIPVDGFGDHLTPLVLAALGTGLRRGELTSLTWADVDFDRKSVVVRSERAKSQKARHIPMNSDVADTLRRWKVQTPEGRLFAIADPKTAWKKLLAAAQITDFTFHDLRHTFASKLVMSGVDLNTVRELMGHASIEMTLRYAHLAPEHTAAAVEKLVRKAA